MSDNSSSSSSSSGGIGFCGLLTIVFITLKLLGKIDWSWWWILSPLWIPAVIIALILCFIGGAALAVLVIKEIRARNQRNERLKAREREMKRLNSSPIAVTHSRDKSKSSWLN